MMINTLHLYIAFSLRVQRSWYNRLNIINPLWENWSAEIAQDHTVFWAESRHPVSSPNFSNHYKKTFTQWKCWILWGLYRSSSIFQFKLKCQILLCVGQIQFALCYTGKANRTYSYHKGTGFPQHGEIFSCHKVINSYHSRPCPLCRGVSGGMTQVCCVSATIANPVTHRRLLDSMQLRAALSRL